MGTAAPTRPELRKGCGWAFGASAVATIGFDALATIDTVAIEVRLPRGLSDAKIDDLVRRTSERLCAEFWEGDADLDSFVPDRLEIDWFGLSVLMEDDLPPVWSRT